MSGRPLGSRIVTKEKEPRTSRRLCKPGGCPCPRRRDLTLRRNSILNWPSQTSSENAIGRFRTSGDSTCASITDQIHASSSVGRVATISRPFLCLRMHSQGHRGALCSDLGNFLLERHGFRRQLRVILADHVVIEATVLVDRAARQALRGLRLPITSNQRRNDEVSGIRRCGSPQSRGGDFEMDHPIQRLAVNAFVVDVWKPASMRSASPLHCYIGAERRHNATTHYFLSEKQMVLPKRICLPSKRPFLARTGVRPPVLPRMSIAESHGAAIGFSTVEPTAVSAGVSKSVLKIRRLHTHCEFSYSHL